MKKISKINLIFLVIIVLLIIPQTRSLIQIFIHKGIALVNGIDTINDDEQETLSSYHWVLKDESGFEYNFKESKGKIVLINFWATWCPPCIAEMPSLQKLYSLYGDKIDFLFVTNDSKEQIKSFKNKNDYNFPVYQIVSKPIEELQTMSIPRTMVIDKTGKIVIDKSGALNWYSDTAKEKINELLMN